MGQTNIGNANNTNIISIIVKKYITIKDRDGILHKWLIEEDLDNRYKLSCNGFITELSKNHTYLKNETLYSSDVRNPWCTLENKKYSKAEYFEIWLER